MTEQKSDNAHRVLCGKTMSSDGGAGFGDSNRFPAPAVGFNYRRSAQPCELVRGQETRAQQVELVRGRETRAQQISASRIGGQHSHVQRGAIGISRDLVNAKNAKEPGEIGRIKEVVAAEMFGKCGQK